ncbi:MAG: histidine--tRNA ligase [Acidobacteria bacterium]|nr:histidine--tRNA ligase [Acidobacteriota bacterium]
MSQNTNPARGMRDFLPAQVRRREYVISIIKEVYESYGFEPLETPAVENLETLTGKYGEEGNQLIYKILKRGEKLNPNASEKDLSDLALRYDLTVPLARVVAQHKNDLPKFFKRYQIQPVWRADRPARGRYREFYQCDVDAIGSSSMIVEAELCAAVSEILVRLGFNDFVIRINHREILYAMLDAVEIVEEKQIDALVALDKLDKIGGEGVLKEFESREINEGAANKLLGLFEKLKNSDNSHILESLSEFIGNYKTGTQATSQISQILKLAGLKSLKIDASLARGLSYYTGAIFEVNVPDLSGSIASGGRYDGLIGMFGKEQIPACGFSLGLERILVVMEERGMFPKELETNSADVLMTIWNEESIGESLKLAGELRQENLRVLVYPEADKLGKQFKYASQINVLFVCVLGENELAENKVTLKNMQTGDQETINRDEAAVSVKTYKKYLQSKS